MAANYKLAAMTLNLIRGLASLACSLVLAGCVMPPKPYRKPAPAASARPVDTGKFWWGTSTASFQNEDRGVPAGSPLYYKTDWDIFAEEGRIPPRGEEATFSWTHFDKDLAALKKIGVNHYRFGIEWARVEPQPGFFNEAAIQQYVT
ncbi:MAG: family 1 glycosylhydrolase, partial [Deltaproteobacteria bacterium]